MLDEVGPVADLDEQVAVVGVETLRETRVPWVCQSSQMPSEQSWIRLWRITTSMAACSLMPAIS